MTRLLPPALLLAAACALAATAATAATHQSATHQSATHQPTKKHGKKTTAAAAQPPGTPKGIPYGQREDVMAQALDIAQRRDLDPEWVRQAMAQARLIPQIPQLMLPPPKGTAKNWRVYRSRFVEPQRIAAGLQFWQVNRDWLQRAQAAYGVPPEIVVGIIGVETIYGRQMGNFRVIDALATLAFDFPKAHPRAAARQAFFLAELEQFLSLSSRTGADPLAARGSYAGAMGLPQFMPSSWARYAVDFDGDGKVDLFNSPADAIGSVASYFQGFNWRPGMPTHYAVRFEAARLDLDALLAPDILPSFSVASLAAKGALVDGAGQQHSGQLALVELQNGDAAPQYVAGTDNFYAITRYNWSSYYAMAVIELGQAVSSAMAAQAARNTPPAAVQTAAPVTGLVTSPATAPPNPP